MKKLPVVFTYEVIEPVGKRVSAKLVADFIRDITTEEEKIKLMQRAWAFVNPSYIEGWGITVIEANACGTLVVASDVAGLRDSVKNSYNGFLVDYGNITAFSSKIIEVLQNSLVRESCSKNAVIWASKFSWDMSAQLLISIIKGDLYL